MNKFVTEKQAEALAAKHIENYLNECNCQTVDDAKKAAAKMLAVAINHFETIQTGSVEKLPIH
ncbi:MULTISPECIES: hypothetical protein [Vibrio]|uniref:hypothetical protein n=1 Tax=Vibrio TaxID=662 RepID=UPI00021AA5D9|nr:MULTISPECIES: hypothetical protein [Vibrio]EGS66956.1 hypothetical protein VCHE09_3136 [Vibrio paracholerae HE-09]TQP89069.1 hypothetical protein FLL74_06850 [Vibrio cholerae]